MIHGIQLDGILALLLRRISNFLKTGKQFLVGNDDAICGSHCPGDLP
jgi:hypothetical protein